MKNGRAAFINNEQSPSPSVVVESTFVNTGTEKERRTEKSVRFASENESHSDDKSSAESSYSVTRSRNMVTWLPSEELYNDDTFISSASQKDYTSDSTNQTDPSYGTNTFIDSEDETRTLSEYSYTDSFASSGVFSSQSQSDRTTFREWTDGREIIKDIEELEESEFVTSLDGLQLKAHYQEEEDRTDISESDSEEMLEVSKFNFLDSTIRRLKLKVLESPCSLDQSSQFQTNRYVPQNVQGPGHKEEASFCQKMIRTCRRTKSSPGPALSPDPEPKHQVLEFYGLSSGIVDRLKTDSFQYWLKKKLSDIDKETEKSLEYIRNHQYVHDALMKQQCISQMKASIRRENIDDCIQSHLIRMHPVKMFSDLISDLPRFNEDSREILYRYKKQIENRIQENG